MVGSDASFEDRAPALELLESIGGTDVRSRVLLSLAEGPWMTRELATEHGLPRTTIGDNLRVLSEEGLVERTIDGAYRLTPRGRITVEGLQSFRMVVRTGLRLEAFVECVPWRELDLDFRWFEEADITPPRRTDPYAPARRLRETVERHDSIRGFAPVLPPIDPGSIEGTELEFVVGSDGSVSRGSSGYPIPGTGVDLAVTDRGVPCGALLVGSDRVLLVGFDANDKPHAVVEVDTERCREWVQSRYEDYREDATFVVSDPDAT